MKRASMEHNYEGTGNSSQQPPLPPPPRPSLAPEWVPLLVEGVSLVLSRWTALQMAVQDEWGGRDSRRKADEFGETLLSWFANFKDPLDVYDLEDLIEERMITDFNAELEDGSIQEVAGQLMDIYEECLSGYCTIIERLRETNPAKSSVSQSKQVTTEGGCNSDDDEVDDYEENSEETSDMAIDEPIPEVKLANVPKSKQVPDEDGWCVVAPRKNRGKKQG